MKIGFLPQLPFQPLTAERGRLTSPAVLDETDASHGQPVPQEADLFIQGRSQRAHLAALQVNRFELQPDLSRRAQSALRSYLDIQTITPEDQSGELIGVDIIV